MKFVVSSTALLSHLQAISKVINSKNTIPILDSFLFELDNNSLKMTASDGETTLITSMEVSDVEGSGKFAVSAKLLLDPLKEFPEQPLKFDINDENIDIFIYFQNGKCNFIGQKGEEYPQMPEIKEGLQTLTMPVDHLLDGLNRTFFATGDDELRPIMNGIYLDITPEDVTFVATNGHKLVRYKMLDLTGNETSSFILPKKPATLLRNILPKESGDAKIEFDDKNAMVTIDNYKMICRLIEGKFPNYNSVIPTNNPFLITVDRVNFMAAMKRVSVFANQGTCLVKLAISENNIILTAQDIDFSTSAEEVIACQYSGEDFSIGFKADFFIDLLNNLPASDIVIGLSDPSRAGTVIPLENEENEDLLMLLMPMMLNDDI
ncbi:MAG: DNA polymerase III subunit beta [Candidatus Azobacteroides sp.]|nr:DNA polymerase III subunit beta [Candidatus Azobacteroides sp.]